MIDDTVFYSENGEDFLLWQLFKDTTDGFYIDIGANDGIQHNNSYYFEKRGWEGVCVESNPSRYSLCKNNRRNAICLNLPVGKSGSMEVAALKSMLHRHLPKTKHVPFISINLGSDGVMLDLLGALGFHEWFTDVVIIKTRDYELAKLAVQSMLPMKFTLARILPNSCILSRHDHMIEFLKYKRIECELSNASPEGGCNTTGYHSQSHKVSDMSRWIAPNVLCQLPHQPLWSLLDYFPKHLDANSNQIRLVHIVNPYMVAVNTVSGRHQQLTYESMHAAREFDRGKIDLVSVQDAADPDITPNNFTRGRSLERVVTDVAKFKDPHRLPLLFDILERGAELAEEDDYIIYTNSDIILMPHFYSAVKEYIGCGFDAISVCRRTIGEHPIYLNHVNIARSEVGSVHPGSDCFIFSNKAYKNYCRNDACIGRKVVARSLLFNMAATARKFLILRNVGLTYHIGDDRVWNYPDMDDYTTFNRNELEKTYRQLSDNPKTKAPLDAYIKAYWQ